MDGGNLDVVMVIEVMVREDDNDNNDLNLVMVDGGAG